MPRPKGNGPGIGGPAKGAGWGGPPKGASTSRILPGDPDGIRALARDPANKALKDQFRAELWGKLHSIAMTGESEATQLMAADKLLDRIDGKAKQTQEIQANVASYVVRAPAEPASEDEWLAQHKPIPAR